MAFLDRRVRACATGRADRDALFALRHRNETAESSVTPAARRASPSHSANASTPPATKSRPSAPTTQPLRGQLARSLGEQRTHR